MTVRPLRDARLAVSLLTVVPTCVEDVPQGGHDAPGWFPAVGLALGAVAFGLSVVAGRLGLLPAHALLVSVLVTFAIALLTRFLHYDGLADVADAWWGGATVQRRLEIMKDSHVGSFGVVTLVFVSLATVAAIADLLSRGILWPLLVVPVFGRCAATFASWFGSPARADGLGRSVAGTPGSGALVPFGLTMAGTVALSWLLGGTGGVFLPFTGLLAALVMPHLIAKRMGGVTGDVMGASVLVTEMLMYVLWAVVQR